MEDDRGLEVNPERLSGRGLSPPERLSEKVIVFAPEGRNKPPPIAAEFICPLPYVYQSDGPGKIDMECVAVMAASAGIVFAKLATIQDLNPFLWGLLALVVYAGAPAYMIWRGASWMEAPFVWISSLGGLVVLFVIQSIIAAARRHRGR
jgi:hypothetical protein